MSTRTNIIIKGAKDSIQLYHHHDGYPEGVGADIQEMLQKMIQEGINIRDHLDIAYFIHQEDDSYRIEDVGPHGDIEYLYIIDTTKAEVRCYERINFKHEFFEHIDEMIEDKIEENKFLKIAYKSKFSDKQISY